MNAVGIKASVRTACVCVALQMNLELEPHILLLIGKFEVFLLKLLGNSSKRHKNKRFVCFHWPDACKFDC